jgi:hypothetical protein
LNSSESKTVRFKGSRSSRSRRKEDNDPLSLVTKLQGLSIHEPSYLVLYAQCQERFPEIAHNLPKPQLHPAASSLASITYQSAPAPVQPPQPHLHQQLQFSVPLPVPTSAPTSTSATADTKTDFFYGRYSARAKGCTFCGHLGHRIHSCPAAEEYVDNGRVKIINRRLYLPTGQPIPNDGRGLGLKAGVDAWLAATVPTVQRDSRAAIEVPPNPAPARAPAPKTPSQTSAAFTSTSFPSAPNADAPQYRSQAGAEEQVTEWILEGKLDQIAPAHIFATSPAIRKELAERLRLRRVETGSVEQVNDDSADPVAVPALAAKREAESSLPRREINVLVKDLRMEAGVLDQGSQIVTVREDLAQEVGARINTQRTLRIKGANGSTSRTLGCAEDLNMRIGDVSFTLNAHVVRRAPFRLLLGRPFHDLLLCRLEDRPGRVDVSIRDPAKPSRSVTVRAR